MATDLKRQMAQEQKESVEIKIYNIVRAVDYKFPVAKVLFLLFLISDSLQSDEKNMRIHFVSFRVWPMAFPQRGLHNIKKNTYIPKI